MVSVEEAAWVMVAVSSSGLSSWAALTVTVCAVLQLESVNVRLDLSARYPRCPRRVVDGDGDGDVGGGLAVQDDGVGVAALLVHLDGGLADGDAGGVVVVDVDGRLDVGAILHPLVVDVAEAEVTLSPSSSMVSWVALKVRGFSVSPVLKVRLVGERE